MLELSAVIPTCNRLDTLRAVLEAFDHQTFPASGFEVILVDSQSEDGTEEFARNFRPRSGFSFRYFRQENRGRSGARNRGILESAGRIIVFCDADIVPEKTFLEAHADFHRAFSRRAAVGWESRINSLSELPWAAENPGKRFRIHAPKRKELSWLYFLTGNASTAREALLEAGLFDESFQGYGFEDLELGYRLRKNGVKIYYLPEAVNYHIHPRTLENEALTQKMAGRSAVRFYRKHKDSRIRWLLGMSPPAFWWNGLLRKWPGLYRFLERRAQDGSRKNRAAGVFLQHHYFLGIEEAWGCFDKADGLRGAPVKRIAVVRLDKVGDLLLTTPAIATLKKAYPESRITAVVNRYNKPVIEHSPDVDEILEWSWSLENLRRLRAGKFDLTAVFSPTTASYLAAFLSGSETRAGYVYSSRILARRFAERCLTKTVVCGPDQKNANEAEDVPHEVEQNLEVLSALGIPRDRFVTHLRFAPQAEDSAWAREMLGEREWIAVHLSDLWRADLDSGFLPGLLNRLSETSGVFVTCGPAEGVWCRTLQLPDGTARFEDLSLSRWAALLGRAKVAVTPNTGAVHLASSQGTPVAAVFERQFYAYHRRRWAPWQVPSLILRKDDPDLIQKITEGVRRLAGFKENIGSNLQL